MPHLSPPTLTTAEQAAILAATAGNRRDHLIYSLALGTGLRLAEIVGLNVGDLYTPDGTPRSRVRIRPEIAKGGRGGDVFVPDALVPSYVLADQGVRLLGGRLRPRQVTRLRESGHQTPIITSRRDLCAAEVAYRMFERWRQENFFKYLREEYALDALVDYGVEPDDAAREVPNPAWNALTAELREARADLTRLSAKLGIEALVNTESVRRTVRGFKIANAKLGQGIWATLRRVTELEAKRAKVPPAC